MSDEWDETLRQIGTGPTTTYRELELIARRAAREAGKGLRCRDARDAPASDQTRTGRDRSQPHMAHQRGGLQQKVGGRHQ